jgi:hypothetical protein
VLVLFLLGAPLAAQDPTAVPIADNSFLVEEAYNQEPGVVQHIATFERGDGGGWVAGLTQEWPLGGRRHQGSYRLALLHDGGGTGPGDVEVNYRLQALGMADGARVALAPRLTVLLPVGDETEGRGAGGAGIQVALPLSARLAESLVAHLNAGGTLVPSARNALGATATTREVRLAGSVVWLARPAVNLLLEGVWRRGESVVAEGETVWGSTVQLNPGVRFALNLPGDLQIVPGAAYTIGLGPSAGTDALFLYLSAEHPLHR